MTIIIDHVTHLGLGRATDGTLVPRTLPGEEVTLGADGLPRIVTPSPARVAAPCRHFKTCGGCTMQHASDAFVADWKTANVLKALSYQGINPEVASVETSPAQSRRRAKFSGRKTKSGALVGFHSRGSDTIVAIPECQLISAALKDTLPALEALTVMAASRTAEIALTVTESRAGADVMVETDRELTRELREALAVWAEKYNIARLVWSGEQVAQRHAPPQKFGPADVVMPPGAFMQATAEGEAALLNAVRRIIGPAKRVVDLFAGCGTFTLPMSTQAEVHAVESESAMLDALDKGWRRVGGLSKVSTEARDLFRRPLLPDEFKKFDAVVIDPPRAGAEAQMAELAQSGVKVIAMVSCNPVTFARDAKTLIEAGYVMSPITIVDQFRWSPHTELVAGFTRK